MTKKFFSIHFRVLLVLIMGLFILVGCEGEPVPTPKTHAPLRFGFVLWPGYYPALIAQDRGFFAEEGVEVTLLQPQNDSWEQMMADFTQGKYDAVGIALGTAIRNADQTPDMRIIIVCDESAGGDAFAVQPHIKSLNDLPNQTIGYLFGTFGELFVTKYLHDAALDTQNISTVNVEAAGVPELLRQNQIQGGHTWEPYVTEARAAGFNVLFSSKNTPGLIPDVVIFHQEFIEQRPDDVQAFVNAWFKAVDFWQANPDEGIYSAAKLLGVEENSISLEGIKLLDLADNQRLFSEDSASLYLTTQLYSDFFIRTGQITVQPDLLKILDNPFMQKNNTFGK